MRKKKNLIINGPNLNLLGDREACLYGKEKLKDLYVYLKKYVFKKNITITFFQSNEEGKIIENIHKARKKKEGIIINAGAYSHTSIAILDALRAYQGLIYEVHLSNIYAREKYRRISYISEVSNGVICGLGFLGYELAIDAIVYN